MIRGSRGFALLAALWLVVALTAIGGVGVGVAQLGTLTTRNRVLLARAGWAREACVETLQARYADDPTVRAVPRVELGRTWCAARVWDPGTAVHLDLADSAMLARLVGDESLLRAVLARRAVTPFSEPGELLRLTGDTVLLGRLLPLVTTRGTGLVNLNAATVPVLRALPGFGEDVVRAVAQRRSVQALQSLDEVLGVVSAGSREALLAVYPDLMRTTSFAPMQLVAVVEGGVQGTALVSRATLTLVPLPERLAVVRREVE
jgi:type II secretory pathway component PulK